MVKRVLLLMVLVGPALALIGGSKAPSSSLLFVIRDNVVGVDPVLMLGNSILALENVLFASPLMSNFAVSGAFEVSTAATVAALPRCDDGALLVR